MHLRELPPGGGWRGGGRLDDQSIMVGSFESNAVNSRTL